MGVSTEKLYTWAEYVALEDATGVKHTYDHGVVKAFEGVSPEHVFGATQIGAVLENLLTGKPCKPFIRNLKVKVGPEIIYPDVSVFCPPVKRDPEFSDALVNPRVMCDVFSDAAEACDQWRKFALYRQNPELAEYVLISATRVYAERYRRTGPDTWNLTFLGAESTLHLTSIDCEISLASLYEGMEMLAYAHPEPK